VELKDLTTDERIALAALLEMVVQSAATLTDGDVDQVRDIVAEVGEQAYREAAEEADRRFGDEDAVRRFLTTVTRQDAREVIYEAALDAALPDSINARESELLDWLAKQWRVSVRIEPETGAR
jgi:hypothetical protein